MLDSIYHMTNTLKYFWRKNAIHLSLCTQRCYGHNVSRKSLNHKWFIDFIAWRYFTPRRDDATSYDKYIYSTLYIHTFNYLFIFLYNNSKYLIAIMQRVNKYVFRHMQ